ncbi:MAG: hypothetical protein ACRERU_16235, partial [Methylococcales bacterium]
TWSWVPIDPASGLAQGNPPSGVAAWYCLVDAVAIAGAPVVAHWLDWFRKNFRSIPVLERDLDCSIQASLGWYINHAKFPVLALIIIL